MGFHNPAWLALGALIVPLVLLYVLKVRRERQRISSTWLWDRALREVEAQVPFRRLRRDWLLLLQILILALLALAAASPFRRTLVEPGGRTALVVDAAAGMLAGDRPERSRRQARRLIAAMGTADKIVLLRAASRPEVLVPLTGDRWALRDGIERLTAAPATSDLESALRLARSVVGTEGRIVLITDGARQLPGVERPTVVRVGDDLPNVGITALGVRPSDPSGLDHQVFVRLHNASPERVRGTLKVLVDGSVRDASAVEIEAEGEASRTLQLLDLAQGVLEARWESETRDALSADDAAFWVVRRPRPRTWRTVGRVDAYLGQALAAVDGWREALPDEPADLEVLLRRSPEAEGPPFLWVDPLELREGFVEGGLVLDWDRTHPVTRFADLNGVRLGRSARVGRPPGARILAESSTGPFMLEASRGNRRYVAWAFDPLQTDLPLRVSFPVLVQNTLEYLAPVDAGLPGGVHTGEALELAWSGAGPVTLVGPSNEPAQLPVHGGILRLPPLEQTGVWSIEDGSLNTMFAASLLDGEMTDLRPRPGGSPDARGEVRSGEVEARAGAVDLVLPLALAALALLLFEGLGFHRKWSP